MKSRKLSLIVLAGLLFGCCSLTWATTYTLSVKTSGLPSGATLVVEDTSTDKLTFTKNATQTFTTTYTDGESYSVTIVTQPTDGTCTLGTNASGTFGTKDITVDATCVGNSISVKTSGLTSGQTLVVEDTSTDKLTFTTNTTETFATKYTDGESYSVTIVTQPATETCTLGSNASGSFGTANITVDATCVSNTISVAVTGLTGTVELQDDKGDTLTFTKNETQKFKTSYAPGSSYYVYVTSQPTTVSCIPTYSTGTIGGPVTIDATCATGATRALGTVSGVSSITCEGSITGGVCQQMTVSCPGLPNVDAYIKTNSPTGTSLGTVTYTTGTDGNGLYDSIFTYGSTAVQNVINAGYTTVQISWGTPFNQNQPDGWVLGPGGVLATACRNATLHQWIYDNVQNNSKLPFCATGNSGGAGALAYSLSQYPTANILSMAEVTSGPPPGRLDWGCGCEEGTMAVQCGTSSTLGTCFGDADAPVWDPAYDPNETTGVCTTAVNGTLPPGGLNFFYGDSVEAPGAVYDFPTTYVNLVFGSADDSSAIPIGQHWFNNITSSHTGQVCVAGGEHSMADTLAGAEQIANDLIAHCQIQ
jgi:azurin